MVIGDRLKTLRETKNLSQGDIETDRVAPLLRFASREWPHDTGGRDFGKICACSRTAAIPSDVRR